jgi:hypothetical protein
VDIPSRLFDGAVVEDVVIADNVGMKFLGDSNVFGGAQIRGLSIRDVGLESIPENLFKNLNGLERLYLTANFTSLTSAAFSGLGSTLKSL